MRILFSILLLLSITAAQAQSQSPEAITAYIERYKAVAIEEMKNYGIPASVTLAQGIHESGCGQSTLALNSNNHFGIKCHEEWNGQTYHHDDDKPQECFRVYTTPEESFRDHSEFLKTRPRYASLFSLEPGDYKGWAKGLKAAGYATNPKYPDIIIKLVEDYKLNQYDDPKSIAAATGGHKDNSEVEFIKQSLQKSATTSSLEDKIEDNSKSSFEEKRVNDTKAVLYKKSTHIGTIARKYGITKEQLLAYNDMGPKGKFAEGDIVYVESKKPEAAAYQYEIAKGETMHYISQKFAVQLPELLKRNGIKENSEPLPGEIIVLRGKREYPLKYKLNGKVYSTKITATASTNSDIKTHKVGSKETLYSISKQYNIPLDTLKRINGLKDEDIKVGQTLIVNL